MACLTPFLKLEHQMVDLNHCGMNARQHKSHKHSALEPTYHKAFPGLQDPVGKRIMQCIENELAQLIKFSADSSPCWPYSQLVCYWKVNECTRIVDVHKRTHQRGVVPGPQLTVQEQARTSAEFWNSGPTHTTCYKITHCHIQLKYCLLD